MVRRLNLYGGDRIEDAIAALKALSQAFPGENFFVKFNNIYVFPFDTIGSYLRKMHDGGAYLKEQLESHPEYDLKEMEQAVGFDYSAKPDPAKVEEAVLHYLRSVEKERRGNMHKVADSSIYFSPVVISDDKYDSDLSVFDVEPVIEVRGLRHDGGNEVWGLVRQENLDDFDSDIDYNEDWRRLDVSELLKVLEGNKDLAKKVKAPVVLDYGIGIDVNLFAKQFGHDIRYAHSFVNDSSIDPATVATLHLEKEFDTGLAIYSTEPSLESRDDLIRVLFSHYNKDSYPWYQLQNDDYLNYNWSHPNRVAFVDGHPVAFNYGVDDPCWLDPYGVGWLDPNGKHEIWGSIDLEADPLGRSVEAVFNEDGSVRYNGVFRMVDRFYLEIFESVESSIPESIKVSLFDVTTDIPEKFIIKDGTTIIGFQAFAGCKSLKEVYIPGSVRDIESFAFYGCDGLERIIVADNLDKSLVSKISSAISVTLPHCKILTESESAVQLLEPFFDKDVFGRLSPDNPIVSVETDKLCCDLALSSASGKYEVFILPPGLDEPVGRFVDYVGSDGALRYDDIINDIMVALAERDLMESNELSAELSEEDLAALDGLGLPKEDIDVLSKTGRFKGEDFDFVIKDDGRVWCRVDKTEISLEEATRHVDEVERMEAASVSKQGRGKGV